MLRKIYIYIVCPCIVRFTKPLKQIEGFSLGKWEKPVIYYHEGQVKLVDAVMVYYHNFFWDPQT